MNDDALFQLGMGLDDPKTAQKEDPQETSIAPSGTTERHDYFVEKEGVRCAGSHLIIDLYGARGIDNIETVERALLDSVKAAGATLLHMHLHPFEPDGVSGVAVLAESHISIHTWPEREYAALDVFMCGDTHPEKCLDVLKESFSAERMLVKEILRGKEI